MTVVMRAPNDDWGGGSIKNSELFILVTTQPEMLCFNFLGNTNAVKRRWVGPDVTGGVTCSLAGHLPPLSGMYVS
eukprot:364784-Chlamydomonas_euryale.AAC.3